MPWVWAGAVTLLAVIVCIWQDGDNPCCDGDRYTSGKPQPYPFHRRFCGWPTKVLKVCSVAGLTALGAMMGDAKHALLLATLPGFWFCAVHLTCVDGPSMALALAGALLFPHHPIPAVALSAASGFIHERGPVFAALYAGHPLLLLGLLGMGWWRKPTAPDADRLVGRGLVYSIFAHRPYTDWLDWKVTLLSLRAVPLAASYYGASPKAWLSLLVAWASRLVGTDGARFMFWGAPLLIKELPPELPWWLVVLHALTFRRIL